MDRLPRRNPARSISTEVDLARRIAWERERRGLTYDALAQRMTAAGCPIQATAIFKVEKGDPPRRITVNELVGFSRALEIPAIELLQSIEAFSDLELGRTVNRAEIALRELNAAVAATEQLTAADPARQYALKVLLREFFGDWPELSRLFRWALRGELHHGDEPQPQESRNAR